MADEAEFAITLVDKASAPARRIARAVGQVNGAFRAVGVVQPTKFVDEGGFNHKKQKKLVEKVHDKIDSLSESLWSGAKAVGLLVGGLAAVGAFTFAQQAISMAMFAENSRLAFKNLTGSSGGFERAVALANDLGLAVTDTAYQYQKLLAAQFKIGEAESIIKLAADMKAIGTSAQNVESIIYAISQIKSKGTLQGQELNLQLANAGVSAALVYQALIERGVGKNVDDVRKAISAGKVTADVGIAAIQDAIMRKVHEHAPGEAGREFSNTTLTGLFGRLKNAPANFFLKLDEQSKSLVPRLKEIVKVIDQAVASVSVQGATGFLDKMVGLLEAAVPLAIEFAAGFAEGFSSIVDALGGGDIEATKKSFHELGKSFAQLVTLMIDFGKICGEVFNLVMTPVGRFIAETVVAGLVISKLAIGLGTIGELFGATAGVGLLSKLGAFGTGLNLVGSLFSKVAGLFAGGEMFAGIGAIFTTISEAVMAAGAALLGWPALVIAGIGLAVAGLWYFWDDIKSFGDKIDAWMKSWSQSWLGSLALRFVGLSPDAAAAAAAGPSAPPSAPPSTAGSLGTGEPTASYSQPSGTPGPLAMAATTSRQPANINIRQIMVNSSSDRPQDLARDFADELKRALSIGVADAATGA